MQEGNFQTHGGSILTHLEGSILGSWTILFPKMMLSHCRWSIFALLLHSLVCFSFSDAPACLPGDNRVCACVCGIGVGGSWFIVLRGRKPIISNFAILSVISLHQPGFDVWEPGHCIPRIHNNYIGFLRLPKEFVF